MKFAILSIILAINAMALSVVDMRGKSVEIPDNLEKIATISDGFVEGVLTHLGKIDKVSSIASWSLKRDYKYKIQGRDKELEFAGLNTMRALHPWLDDLPCFNSPQGNIINYETLINSSPELIILRVGDCTIGGADKMALDKTISTLEATNIPLIVLYSPTYTKDLSTMRDEMAIIGKIFGKADEALGLYDYLASIENLIKAKVANVSYEPRVLYLGLSLAMKKNGASGITYGIDTPESLILESLIRAKNALPNGKGSRIMISAEQIYGLDPDVILLPTYNGYHPAFEIYESPNYANLSQLRALKEKRVYSLPWTPMNCSRRLEYPLELLIIAKAAHQQEFKDINIAEFAIEFYKKLYNIDDEKAKMLRKTQLLDWTQKF
ncbi:MULTISPECIES: ABC transporter substrate-binding protein [Campylobacter]|uniref:ABC transporter substrate-binding protein n=1 Tax=Campylobacter porcelli TaxID=1660073 RepID=A0ABU7M4I5_9BACT|nr:MULTISPECIES: ABC transporter substrate-binding protein [unclassified Campylobacter]MCR8679082.1 ABC transporter substrate-binding protein [Campylobacter sp. RM19072]MCR8696093.1 ABC transporter substrate-binding protein [Campylobacter sp. RM19073]MEE3704652.1 ABC transporter substrate-binding protein [Campylobacter sp. CX2-8023-23]MEE3744625.1 ABC transporter substrate-binding protein [Campylobacter sp. CX2-4855-23]MEE3776350.1 ABC transporter substrate-binding protein [Campylobacter sp. C